MNTMKDVPAAPDTADYKSLYESLAAQLKKLGRWIPCSIGGTFENHPPDAIVDAAQRRMLHLETQANASDHRIKSALATLQS